MRDLGGAGRSGIRHRLTLQKEVVMRELRIPRLTPTEAELLERCVIIRDKEYIEQQRIWEDQRPALYIEAPRPFEKREEEVEYTINF